VKPQTHARLRRPATPLTATAVGAALLVSALAAQAQDATQTITVTGIRKGIEDAISVKKNADAIVEAMSAEDIGKLPDASVAESISRLPGITVQRSAVTGRAQQVSLRGMPPDFGVTLLNGREQATTSASRSVELDLYPAELVGGATVYKSSNASLMTQGLSGTVDIQTVRPLAFSQRTIAGSYKHEMQGKAENLPGFTTGDGDRASLSYIDQFADRTIGVALGVTKAKSNGNARPNFNTWGGWVADVDYNGTKVKTPGGFTTDIETTDSQRTGAMAVLQFKPNKDFESVLDVFYSKGDFSVKKRGLEGPLGGLSAGANDLGGKLINATIVNGVATSGTFENWKGVIRNHNEDYTDELNSIGWGNTLKTGGFTLKSDLSYSKVTKNAVRYETTAGLAGNAYNAADTISFSGFNGTNLADVKYKSGLNYADPAIIKLTDVQGWAGANGVQDGYYANPVTTDKIQAIRLSAQKDVQWGPVVGVEFGANYADRTKDRVAKEGALVIIGGLNADGTIKDRLISTDMPGATVGVGGLTGIPTLNWDPAGSLGKVYQLNPWSDHDIVSKSWGVKEKITTAFVKGDVDSEIAGLPVRGNVGLQLVGTKQSGSSFLIDQSTCNGGTHQCSFTAINGGASYTDVLPSLNLAADLGGDRVLRLGAGRVVARANMEDMKAGIDFSYDSTENHYKGTAGNPQLKPFRADALDISFEQYFGKKGYISVAGFHKNLKSYIVKVAQAFDYSGLLLPGAQPVSANDTLTRPINGDGGRISGVEVAVNVPFSMLTESLDGFGVMVNYGNTSSSVKIPTAGVSTANISALTIPLPGLSKETANLRLYYEKHGFQVAAAARYRSDFIGEISDYQDKTQLVGIKAETQIDLQLAYEFASGPLKGLSLLAQGNNLTNTEFVRYDIGNGNVTDRKRFGKSYLVGLSYKF